MPTSSRQIVASIQFLWVMLLAMALASGDVWALGQGCGSCNVCASGAPGDCPTPQPVFECGWGQALYWHNHCDEYVDECRWWEPRAYSSVPKFYGSLEFLALARNTGDRVDFQALAPMGPIVLSSSSFDDEFEGLTRTMVGVSLGDWYRLEGVFFGTYQWSDLAAVRNFDGNDQASTGNLQSPFSDFGNPTLVGVDYNNFAQVSFTSELFNAEMNLRRRLDIEPNRFWQAEASFLVGLRYMSINEDFNYLTQSIVPPVGGSINDIDVATDNSMFGVQIGWLGQFLVANRAWIDVDVKGGIYNNQIDFASAYTNTDNNQVVTNSNFVTDADRTSFVGDLSLTFNYHIAPSWTFRAGYNAIWVEGIAIGQENLQTELNILQFGPPQIDHSGSAVYHGPSLGVVWAH